MLHGARQILAQPTPSANDMEGVPLPAAKLALVVPTLHEVANIEKVLQRIRTSLDPLGIPYELIVVDDDSGDGTALLYSDG